MKIKYDKCSLDITPKDVDFFNKLSSKDQLKLIALFIGGLYALNEMGKSWYKLIKEERRKDKLLDDNLEVQAEISKIKNDI